MLDDRIYALDGDDYINAVLGWSTTNDSDSDKLFGGKGDDDLGVHHRLWRVTARSARTEP